MPAIVDEAALLTDLEIVSTLSTQLRWSHFIELLPIKDPLARDFYAEMCRIERWDVRSLRQKIGGLLFQRTAWLSWNDHGTFLKAAGLDSPTRAIRGRRPVNIFRPISYHRH